MAEPVKMHHDELADLIARDVRRHAHCEGFKSVSLDKLADDRTGANWAVKSANFGDADQDACRAALREVEARMQREYRLR